MIRFEAPNVNTGFSGGPMIALPRPALHYAKRGSVNKSKVVQIYCRGGKLVLG